MRSRRVRLALLVFLGVPSAAMAACQEPPPAAGAWYPTVAPYEGGSGSERDHLFAAACTAFETNSAAGGPAVDVRRAPDLPGLYNAVTRARDQIFALGGAYGKIDAKNGPYVVALDANSLRRRWTTRLPGMAAEDWNYPGVLGVHRNGDLYAIYSHRLARLDAATGAVKGVLELPTNQSPADVSYNGFVLLHDGMLVAKSIHRAPGCTAPDFQAFLQCRTAGVAASNLVVIDPERMTILDQAVAEEHIRFRVTVAPGEGEDLVYLPGETRIHRYRWRDGRLRLDTGWRADYLEPGQTAGTAVAVMGDWIVVQTNGIPSDTPMSIVAVSQRDAARKFRLSPFADATRHGSFIPSLPTVDADRRRIFTFDGFVGEAAAIDFDEASGLHVAWRVPQRSFAFSVLVGPPNARVWIGTDLNRWLSNAVFSLFGFDALRWLSARTSPSREDVVWREAATGREIARAEKAAAVGGGAPVPGFGGALLLPDLSDGSLAVIDRRAR